MVEVHGMPCAEEASDIDLEEGALLPGEGSKKLELLEPWLSPLLTSMRSAIRSSNSESAPESIDDICSLLLVGLERLGREPTARDDGSLLPAPNEAGANAQTNAGDRAATTEAEAIIC
mmetsp:Transcript_11865/g.25707  ORF Transcript_11865/g.25707 Transcript_11865/m.25707 type:complete len:118 (-) Transcript_11865:147-500(-)